MNDIEQQLLGDMAEVLKKCDTTLSKLGNITDETRIGWTLVEIVTVLTRYEALKQQHYKRKEP